MCSGGGIISSPGSREKDKCARVGGVFLGCLVLVFLFVWLVFWFIILFYFFPQGEEGKGESMTTSLIGKQSR